jgi:hypothetical protein
LLPDYQKQIAMIISDTFNYLHIPEPTNVTEVLEQINLQYVFSVAV